MIFANWNVIVIYCPSMLRFNQEGIVISKVLKIMNCGWNYKTTKVKKVQLGNLHQITWHWVVIDSLTYVNSVCFIMVLYILITILNSFHKILEHVWVNHHFIKKVVFSHQKVWNSYQFVFFSFSLYQE